LVALQSDGDHWKNGKRAEANLRNSYCKALSLRQSATLRCIAADAPPAGNPAGKTTRKKRRGRSECALNARLSEGIGQSSFRR